MKCEACDGRGFTEQFHGLLQLECGECMGSGEVEAPSLLSMTMGENDDSALFTTTEALKALEEAMDDLNSGTGQSDSEVTKAPESKKRKRRTRRASKSA